VPDTMAPLSDQTAPSLPASTCFPTITTGGASGNHTLMRKNCGLSKKSVYPSAPQRASTPWATTTTCARCLSGSVNTPASAKFDHLLSVKRASETPMFPFFPRKCVICKGEDLGKSEKIAVYAAVYCFESLKGLLCRR